jgi:hypothetical protein
MRPKYNSTISFIDLAFNLLICFVCLFSIAFLVMSKKIEKDKKINAKAEFMITVTWPNELHDDVDTWVEDPLGNIVSFNRREQGLMHLDRDDLGNRNDKITLEDGTTIEFKENREIVTVRGIVPGEYVVNAHMYLMRRAGGRGYSPPMSADSAPGAMAAAPMAAAAPGPDTEGPPADVPPTTKVTIKLEKLNPTLKLISQEEIELTQTGDEKTAFRFTVDKDGDITSTNKLFKDICHSPGGGSEGYDGEEHYDD